MKSLKEFSPWQLKMGSNRIVLILKNIVIKFPKNIRGFKANQEEYKNYISVNSQKIATTKKIGFLLIQERLRDIQIFPLTTSKKEIPKYLQSLFDIKLNNRLQVGKNVAGLWKIFDYEDIKYYSK